MDLQQVRMVRRKVEQYSQDVLLSWAVFLVTYFIFQGLAEHPLPFAIACGVASLFLMIRTSKAELESKNEGGKS